MWKKIFIFYGSVGDRNLRDYIFYQKHEAEREQIWGGAKL